MIEFSKKLSHTGTGDINYSLKHIEKTDLSYVKTGIISHLQDTYNLKLGTIPDCNGKLDRLTIEL